MASKTPRKSKPRSMDPAQSCYEFFGVKLWFTDEPFWFRGTLFLLIVGAAILLVVLLCRYSGIPAPGIILGIKKLKSLIFGGGRSP